MLFWIAAALLFLIGSIILQGLRRIPSDPPHVGLVTVFGKRTQKVVREGWKFFLGYPWFMGYIKIKIAKNNLDLNPENLRTPDKAELKIPVSITWRPDPSSTRYKDGKAIKPDKEGYSEAVIPLINFVDVGKEKGVQDIIEDIVHERLRQWAFADNEGPQTWQEALGAGEEASVIILRAVIGDEALERIVSPIPTPILLAYFATPQRPPLPSQEDRWGENWGVVKTYLSVIDAEATVKLKKAVEDRRQQIVQLRQGNGHFKKPDLGIEINRLNIGEIQVIGKVAEVADLEPKEKQEREAEIVELEHIAERVKKLRDNIGLTTEAALDLIQTERGKVTKTIGETRLSVSPETRNMLEQIVPGLYAALFKRS